MKGQGFSLAFCVLAALLAWTPRAWAVEPSVVVAKFIVDIVVERDGRARETRTIEQIPKSSAAAARIGQLPIPFNPTLERVDLVEAYTAKPDGRRVPIDIAAIRTQLAAGVLNVPMFQDIQQKVLVFPDLAAGDSAVARWTREILHPIFPGHFSWVQDFTRTAAWNEVAISVTAPADYPLQTESFGVDFQRSEKDGMVRYAWRYRATDVVAEDLAAVSPWDRLPRLYISSFADYTALAAAYAARSAGKADITAEIAERARSITAGVTDPRERARLLYEWVSARIRYVALYLGAGGVEPHAAGVVLANGYGDCKDHVVLLEALLRAMDIESVPVLVNLGVAYTLSTPPTLTQLNHAITYLPEFDLYVDSTSGVAPFGTLPFQAYGKPAVMVGAAGPAMRRLPLLAPDSASIVTRTEAHIQLDGAILGTSETIATGPAAIALRLTARNVQTAGHEGAARRQLVATGQAGTGVFRFAPPDSFTPRYSVSGSFKLDPLPEILEGDSFAPPLGLQLLVRPGDYLLGPLTRTTLPDTEPTPCFAGTQIEDLSLELPEGRTLQRLPPERRIETAHFSYRSQWLMQGQVIRVRRELRARFDQPLCAGPLRAETARALRDIRTDQRAKVALAAQ